MVWDRLVNALIFAVTAAIAGSFFVKDHRWDPGNARSAFRFFTVQSNALCAAAALLMCIAPAAPWAWTLKYIGTAAVTVTMVTVFVFLAPTMGGLGPLLKGTSFFMHLATPLAAILSFLLWERRGMRFVTALLGLLPVVLYGLWYLYKVVYVPQPRRWEDVYGFNRGGKWPVAFAAMTLGCFAVCMVLMLLQNIPA